MAYLNVWKKIDMWKWVHLEDDRHRQNTGKETVRISGIWLTVFQYSGTLYRSLYLLLYGAMNQKATIFAVSVIAFNYWYPIFLNSICDIP